MFGELIKCGSFAVFQWIGVEFLIYCGELLGMDLKKFAFFSLF